MKQQPPQSPYRLEWTYFLISVLSLPSMRENIECVQYTVLMKNAFLLFIFLSQGFFLLFIWTFSSCLPLANFLYFNSTLCHLLSFSILFSSFILSTMSFYWLFAHLYSPSHAASRGSKVWHLLLSNMGKRGWQPHSAVYFHLSTAALPAGHHLVQRR